MKEAATAWQGFKFAIIGGLSAIVYFCVALLLDQILGLSPVLASVLAYVLSATFSYLGHKTYTFNATGNTRHEVTRFAISALVGFSLASFIPYMLGTYPSVYSYLAVLVIVPATSFILLKYFVFPEE